MPRARALSAGWRIPHPPPPVPPVTCIPDPDYSCDAGVPVRTVLAVYGEEDVPTFRDYNSTVLNAPLDEDAVDYSPLAGTLTFFGGAALTSTRSRYGSVAYENTSSDPASSLRSSATFSYDQNANGDLLFEISAFFTTLVGTQVLLHIPGYFTLLFDGADQHMKVSARFGPASIASSFTPTVGQWTDFAVVFRGYNGVNTSVGLLANGVSRISGSGGNWINAFSGQPMWVGGNGTNPFIGGLSQARVTKTATPFSAWVQPGETYTPMPYPLAQGYNPTLHDCSCANPKTVTVQAMTSVQDTYTTLGRRMAYVPRLADITSNGVKVDGHADFDFGTEDFTLEMAVERFTNDTSGHIFWYEETGGEFSASVETGFANKLFMRYRSSGGVQDVVTPSVFPLNTVQWLTVQRRTIAGVPYWETYLHGVRVDQTAVTGGAASTVNLAGDWYFGRKNAASANPINGAVGQLHVVRGRALRSGDFTSPTLPLCCHG